MSDGFLGRWSRRKQDVREGRPLEEKSRESQELPSSASGLPAAAALPSGMSPVVAPTVEPPAAPLPTLEDVQALKPQSDFRRFVAADVDPQVRNAAMKKLFADPHFNVMDGLDIYIDDYSKPDPLPLSMLRKMASVQFLNLVEPEEKAPTPPAPPDHAELPSADVADGAPTPQHPPDQPAGLHADSQNLKSASPQTAAGTQPTTEDHADTDLRLQ